MLNGIFFKTLRDYRRSMSFWSVGLLLLAVFLVLFYPTIRDSQQAIQEYIDLLPKELMAAFAGDISNYGTPTGFLNSELFFFMVPALFLAFTIGFGSRAIAGEEEGGTLDILLSYPLSRWRLVLEKAGVLVALTLVLGVVLWAGLAIGGGIVGMDISLARIGAGCFSAALLGLAFGMFALALGSSTGNRSMALGLTGGLAVVLYFVNALAPVVDFLEPFQKFSLFYYYIGDAPLTNGLNAGHVGILAATVIVMLGLAVLGFRRRDLSV